MDCEKTLLDLVKQKRFLYDSQMKEYKDTGKRLEAWEEIGKLLNMTRDESKYTWTKLRNSYTNAIKRRRTVAGSSAKKIQKWKLEDEMAFLLPFLDPKKRIDFDIEEIGILENSNHQPIPIFNNSKTPINNQESSNASPKEQLGEDDQEDSASNCSSSIEEPNTPSNINNRTKAKKQSLGKRIKIENNLDACVNDYKEHVVLSPNALALQVNFATDEVEMFFLSLARTVKKLPVEDQIKIKMSVCQTVCEAELAACSKCEQFEIV